MENLQKKFEKLLFFEKKARDMYEEILNASSNKDIIGNIEHIKEEEAMHMQLAEFLIEKSKLGRNKSSISKESSYYLKKDLVFKKYLLDTLYQLLGMRLKTIDLLDAFGKENIRFKRADKQQKDLIKTVAHQLKTPLTTTKWISKTLSEKEFSTKKEKEMTKQIMESNREMLNLIDDLLYSKTKIKREDIDLVRLCKDINKNLKYLTKNQKIILKSFSKSVIAKTDERALVKIISNLLVNAIQYSDKDVVIKIEKEKPKRIKISVSDKGIGIPIKDQKDIFKKFFRASNVEQNGTGLGLHIAKETTKRIRGKLWFESEVNKGTTFYLSLPLT